MSDDLGNENEKLRELVTGYAKAAITYVNVGKIAIIAGLECLRRDMRSASLGNSMTQPRSWGWR